MVSFSCEACADVISKKGLDKHRNQCRGASFSCLDCNTHFDRFEGAKAHTSCISEAQKYQGSLYKEKKSKAEKRKTVNWESEPQEMHPRRAYVEDAPEGDDSQAVAMIDVPPKAPSPPPAAAGADEPSENVNVFDFLVTEETPNATKTVQHVHEEQRLVEHPVHYGNAEYGPYNPYQNGYSQYMQYGFAYGNSPVPPAYSRYDSWNNLLESQHPENASQFVTPAPKEQRKEKKEKRVSIIQDNSEKKRKRHQVEELDLSSAKRPSSRDATMTDAPREERVLHTGLTGGLNKLITDPEFYEDRIDAGPTPILSPIKRSRREDDLKKADRRKSSYASYGLTTIKPTSTSRHATHEKDDRKRYHDDTHHRRVRSPDRERERGRRYHDDKHRPRERARSLERSERTYHDDRYRHRRTNGTTTTTTRNNKRRSSDSSSDRDRPPPRKPLRALEYPADKIDRPTSVQPTATNQIVRSYSSRADLFLSFINKGPDSERGCSINKVLKRYHRERDVRGEARGEDEGDKELWKALRLRRNERGEIVVFI